MGCVSLRVLFTTDFHGRKSAAAKVAEKAYREEVDAIAIAGDVTNFGTVSDAEYVLEPIGELGVEAVFVPGNCDPPSLAAVEEVSGVVCIHGKSVEIAGFAFLGCGGGGISPFNTPFELEEAEFEQILWSAVENKASADVLVTHSPPRNTEVDRTASGLYIGSAAIRRFVEEFAPKIVGCGHVHESRGISRIGRTFIVNPGPAFFGFCAIAEIGGDVKVELVPI